MKINIRHDKKLRKTLDATRVEWVNTRATYRSRMKSVTKNQRYKAHRLRQKMFKSNGSSTIVVNYCVRTGEPRSIMSKFGRNRHIVRDIARRGKLPGVVKSSW
jgi:small subunit ribosomal protein S14